jgi:DNA-binding MarR family transcriptional regulator
MKIKSRVRKFADTLARIATDADLRASENVIGEISHGEFCALEACVDGANTVHGISARLACSIPSTTEILRRLEIKLLIKRTPVTGRLNHAPLVVPTPAGRRTIERMKNFETKAEAELRRMLPRLDIEGLRIALEHPGTPIPVVAPSEDT